MSIMALVYGRRKRLQCGAMDDKKALMVLAKEADTPRQLPKFETVKDGFSRNDVVQAFARAFEMIGGVQRFALWANEHPTEFYKLHSKLLPATTVNIGQAAQVHIVHSIERSPLDDHPE